MSTSRETILDKIKNKRLARESAVAAVNQTEPIYKPIAGTLEQCFKTELETVAGLCVLCNSQEEVFELIKQEQFKDLFCKETALINGLTQYGIAYSDNENDFLNMQTAISSCEFLIARTGTVVISTRSETGRRPISFAPNHIVIARKEQLLAYPEEALQKLQKKYGNSLPSMISFVSGPSRTADIEKTLVLGAHGPKSLTVYIY